MNQQFAGSAPSSGASAILSKLGRFMDGNELRETLYTAALASKASHFRSQDEAEQAEEALNGIDPAMSIDADTIAEQSKQGRDALVRESVASNIRFQRFMPAYSSIGSTPMDVVRRVAAQHRTNNGFKPRVSVPDRFR